MFMETEHNTRPAKRWSTPALIITFWTLIAFLYAGQNFFSTHFQGQGDRLGPPDFVVLYAVAAMGPGDSRRILPGPPFHD